MNQPVEQVQAEEQVQVQTEGNGESTQEQAPSDLDLFKAEFENYKQQTKKELDGLNRKNSELEKEKKALERAKLSEEEKAKAELEDLKSQAEKERAELQQARRERTIEHALVDSGLPIALASRINGNTDEEIEADVKGFSEYINAEVEKRVEAVINSRLGGQPPKEAATPSGTTMKKSDFANLSAAAQMEFMTVQKGTLID
jgi:hypothetical protein